MPYYHLKGLKEMNKHTFPIDILVGAESQEELKIVLEGWKMLILSLEIYEKPTSEFGKYEILVPFKEKEYPIVTYTDTFEKSIRQLFQLGLKPKRANIADGSMTQEHIVAMIQAVQEETKIEKDRQEVLTKEQEKKKTETYTDKSIKSALKIINDNIDRINQLLTLGANIFDPKEKAKLTLISEELKKMRLSNNLNKMVNLLTEAQQVILTNEERIYKEIEDKKFFIDRNSRVTNIDIIQEYANITKAKEKLILKQKATSKEQLYALGGPVTVFSLFFWKDLAYEFSQAKQRLLPIMTEMIEYLLLRTCVFI